MNWRATGTRILSAVKQALEKISMALVNPKDEKNKWFQYGFTLLVLGVIALQVLRNWEEIKNYPWHFEYWSLLLSFFAYACAMAFAVLCWRSIMGRLVDLWPLRTHFRIYCMTTVAKRLPSPVWYIGARVLGYEALGIAKTLTGMALGIEVLIYIFSGFLFSFVFSAVGPFWAILRESPWLGLLAIPLLLLLFYPNWLVRLANWGLRRLKRPPITLQLSSKDVVVWCIYYLGVWAGGAMMVFLLTRSIYPVAIDYLLFVFGAWTISGVIGTLGQFTLITLAGFGIRQAALAYILSFAIPWPVAIAVALLSRILVPIYEGFWALVASKV